MSAIMTGLVWDLPIQGDFGRPEKYILLAYADHADQNGRNIFPSVDLIAKKTGYEERAVQVITRQLEKQGYLVDDGEGPKGTNRWLIPLERLPDGGAKIAPLLSAEGGAKNAPLLKNAPEGNAPEGFAPEPSVVVNDSRSTTTTTGAAAEIFKVYEREIGCLTPLIADDLEAAVGQFPAGWIEDAIAEAARNNKRNWVYCTAILERWKAEGRGTPKPAKAGKPAGNGKDKGKDRMKIIQEVAANAGR